ncbi:MAG: helix-turn-helix transcriptional regulator [Campylobacterales bacterium]|nr:helix-turn-helix transcriptional regulator [Campylobacterales bacterium]
MNTTTKNPIKDICLFLDITQKELSERMGVSEGTVNRWSSKPDEIPNQTLYFINLIAYNSILLFELEKYRLMTSLLKEVLSERK